MCSQKEEIGLCSLESLVEHLQGLGGLDGLGPLDGRIVAERHFCLKWDHFNSNILSNFETFLDTEEFVDVTLTTAEGKSVKAHRILLSACSSYFRELFWEHPSHHHPVIVVPDTSFQELKSLLQFIYHGEVSVAQERLGLLLKLAEALRIKGLARDTKFWKKYLIGSKSSSPEKESESGLDEGHSGSPGSPSLSLEAFTEVTGLSTSSTGSPHVPPSPSRITPKTPAAKRHKPDAHSPLDGSIIDALSTIQPELLSSYIDEDCSVVYRQLNNEGLTPPKMTLVPKTEIQEYGEGFDCNIGRDINEDEQESIGYDNVLKIEEDIDGDDPLNTTPDDIYSSTPHQTTEGQNLVSYAAEAITEDGSSNLYNCPDETDYQLLQQLEFTTNSHKYMQWPSRHPAVCPVCGKFFKFKYNMRIHLKKMHGCSNAFPDN